MWDGEPTWRLEAWVLELPDKEPAKRHAPRETTAPGSVGQSRKADLTFDPDEGTSALQRQNPRNEYADQE